MVERGGLFLGTAVGRRTVALFVVCALVPSTVLAVIAYKKVKDTLLERTREELAQAAKSVAVTIIERFGWVAHSSELARIAGAPAGSTAPVTDFVAVWRSRHAGGGDWKLWASGDTDPGRPPTVMAGDAAIERLSAGQPAIVIEADRQARVWVVRGSERGSLWAAPAGRSLWGFSDDERVIPHVCIVVAESGAILACSADAPHEALVASTAGQGQAADIAGTILSRRSVYLKREYSAPDLAVVTATTMDEALAPVNGFGRTFAMIASASLLAVFFFSHVQIRRTTEPLGKLTEATRLVAEGNLDTKLDIRSNDEFGRLASSFTAMTGALQRQFALHEALDSLDYSALRGVELPEMVSVGADRVIWSTGARCALIAIPVGNGGGGDEQWLTVTRSGEERTLRSETKVESPRLSGSTRAYTGKEARADASLLGGGDADRGEWLSLPLWDAGRMAGVICLQSDDRWDLGGRSVEEARWFADRLALGAANLRMVSSLEFLSVGTITAFARAIDANSRWTAGHS
ncbi:MAG: HAMP domain-containing protein, partial [Gemmatimonadota bacterium]